MKLFLTLTIWTLCALHLHAQNDQTENEIRQLEQLEVQAVLAKDTAALAKIWDKQFVTNNPENQIVVATTNLADRPVLKQPRTAFTRTVEHITAHENLVISMGSETVVPGGAGPNAGKVVKRRYTHIWTKTDGTWKLVARHANVIRPAPQLE